MISMTMAALWVGAGCLITLLLLAGGVVLMALGGTYLARNRRQPRTLQQPHYSATIASSEAQGAIPQNFEDAPQWANDLADPAATMSRDERIQAQWDRERRRSVAMMAIGAALAISGIIMAIWMITSLMS